jgi:peptide/nickel transport system substrate-binding protein
MSVKHAKLVAAAALVVVAALAVTAAASAQSDDEKVVLTVGLTQDLDTPNPTISELVSSYELNTLRYAGLTDLAAADFATEPGLAESYASDDGKTWTYTLREGLEWSDGTPITAEDVAYTINRSREEEWLNYTSTTANLTAEATDDRTVVVTSSVNDPKLPAVSIYVLPKHVYEKLSAKEVGTYTGLDDVASGPFTLTEWKKGQFWRMEANPNFWRGQPAVDEVVFRIFRNADAMVAALESGEIDAAHNVPASAFPELEGSEDIVPVAGEQGGFDYLVLNSYDGSPPRDEEAFDAPHPALTDPKFRAAIAHAIDKETLVERVLNGIATPGTTMSPSANPAWIPELTADEDYEFDLDKARQILDDAGYTDSNGDGIREYEGENIVLRYAIRSESEYSKPYAEFITGWLKEIGIDTTLSTYDDGQLIEVAGKGDFDLYVWGWTPFVDPDPMLSYFQCDQISVDESDFSNYYNDTGICDETYDQLYKQQNTELDPEKRMDLVHEMLTRMYTAAGYIVTATSPDLQAYRTDRFTGWVKQPAETGPVLFTNSSPTYWNLTPTGAASDDGGLSAAGIAAIAIAGAIGVALVGWFLVRRRTAEERE